MHPLAREHLKKVLSRKEVVGSDESCEYYPCHFVGQDCTWCFCPFYPAEMSRQVALGSGQRTARLFGTALSAFGFTAPK